MLQAEHAGASRLRTVLFVHHSNDLYGADVVLLETIKHLDRRRFTPIVVLPKDSEHIGRLAPRLIEANAEVIFVPLAVMRRKYFKPARICAYFLELTQAVRLLRKMIKQRGVDVVHTNTLAVLASALASRTAGVAHIWHVHEILVDPVAMRRFMHAMVARYATVIVCISEAVKQHLLADQPSAASRTVVIANGMDLEKFLHPPDPTPTVREEYGIPADAPLVGMVGKVTRWKGQLVFARAAKAILAAEPNAYFLAVGGVFDTEHFYMENFIKEVAALGLQSRFHIVDYRPNVSGFIHAFDVFVLPSTSPEPFGLVLVEAMASRKAIVATAHGGPLEILKDHETGLLVAPRSAEAIAEAVLALLGDQQMRARLGSAAQREAIERFSIGRFMDSLQALYERA